MSYVIFVLLCASLSIALPDYKNPHFKEGRTTLVHLFEWRYDDIALECENILGPLGYGGVQVSPVTENLIIEGRPWFERYQPVSYRLITRSGSEETLRDMVRRCNAVGVRIYVDIVLNHMTGSCGSDCRGTGGSRVDGNAKNYPSVPFRSDHFHPTCSLNNYRNYAEVRICELVGLHDLNQSIPYVRDHLVTFMNHLIDIGIAGFRIDAAKHVYPLELKSIFELLNNLNVGHDFQINAKPFIYQEFSGLHDQLEISYSDYTSLGRVTDFKYGIELSRCFRGMNPLKYLSNFGTDWALIPSADTFVFIDNHDTQRDPNSWKDILKADKGVDKQYKMAVAFMLAWPFGVPRVMSSYKFTSFNMGPPHIHGEIRQIQRNRDMSCGNGWVCEHRWRQIFNMVKFRNKAKNTSMNDWWSNDYNQIAFCRGGEGFIAFNGGQQPMFQHLQTCLPEGDYCDIISGDLESGSACSGKQISVSQNGMAQIKIHHSEDFDGVIALLRDVKLSL